MLLSVKVRCGGDCDSYVSERYGISRGIHQWWSRAGQSPYLLKDKGQISLWEISRERGGRIDMILIGSYRYHAHAKGLSAYADYL